jgi:hypothetical protein
MSVSGMTALCFGGVSNGGHDAGVCTAPADVTLQGASNIGFRGARFAHEKSDRTEYHSGSAVPALHRVLLDEGFLNRMQSTVRSEAFDSCDLLALRGLQGRDARASGSVIEQHRTGAALAFAAAVLSSGEIQFVAENVQEGPVWVARDFAANAIDIKLHCLILVLNTARQ